VPYGTKDANTVIRYSLEALEFFENFDIELLIVACNSATAMALTTLKQEAKYPVYGVIEPGVEAVLSLHKPKDSHILIIGTNATINSNRYQDALIKNGYNNISAIATPLLVPLVEERIKDKKILLPIFDYYFKGIKRPDIVILGCTHFPLLQNELQEYFKSSVLIHSGDAIVSYLKKNSIKNNTNSKTVLELFASENATKLKEIATNWIDELP
jgi:glutamate racemase